MTTASTLTQRVRRFVRDWPVQDVTTASVSAAATTVTVADATIYSENWPIQIDAEVMRVRSGSAGTTLNVRRGQMGTVAATHVTASEILVKPNFFDIEILDALNGGIAAAFPLIYRRVIDESTSAAVDDYEYPIPDMPGIVGYKIPYISEVWVKDTGDLAYRRSRSFHIKRDETAPFIQFLRNPRTVGNVRLVGLGPFAPLAVGDSLDAAFPPNAEDVLVWYAANYLLASGEAGRVRVDTGAIDAREQANRAGTSMQAANTLFQRFQMRLRDCAMPPMPPHVVPTI